MLNQHRPADRWQVSPYRSWPPDYGHVANDRESREGEVHRRSEARL
jgi:hypothetical protein